jgi:YidC/Oxa1 family membrane protein insertase
MNVLFDGIAGILSLLYDLWPSYGGAIILLTLIVMVVTTPLTLKGTRSMMVMQRLQPEMKRIQDKHKDDREKLNEELLAFYKENDINPMSGCLPLLIQMPVFIVLYRVISGLTLPATAIGVQFGWTGGQLSAGDALTQVPASALETPFQPAYLDHSSAMYQALSGAYTMPFLGLNLAESASKAMSEGIVHALPYLAMIAVVALSGWYQQKQTMARSTSEPNPQQKTISRIMLVFLPLISFGLPAGVVLYFIVSNLYRVGLQTYITRTMFSGSEPIPGLAESAGKAAKGGSAKGGVIVDTKATEKPAKPKPAKPSAKASKGGVGKKTFTNDPKRRSPATPQQAEPRARKKRK